MPRPFADASRGRYANFAALGDPKLGQEEPIRKWWGDVAELILEEQYFGKHAQERVFLLRRPASKKRHGTKSRGGLGGGWQPALWGFDFRAG